MEEKVKVFTKSIAIALLQKEGRLNYKKEGPFDKKVRKYIYIILKTVKRCIYKHKTYHIYYIYIHIHTLTTVDCIFSIIIII